MGILDYHAKYLMPAVWNTDGSGLSQRFRAQIYTQFERFPDLLDVLLIGDAVNHYWKESSPIDLLIRVPDESVEDYRDDVRRLSGFPLTDADDDEHDVHFFLLPERIAPHVMAKNFGPIYSLVSGVWYGTHVRDEMELRRPYALVQRINWLLFRTKRDFDDVFPYDWKMESIALGSMGSKDRVEVLDAVRYLIAQDNHRINRLLREYPTEIWKKIEKLEETLVEKEKLELSDDLPSRIVYTVLHRFRCQDVLDILTDAHEKKQRWEAAPNR